MGHHRSFRFGGMACQRRDLLRGSDSILRSGMEPHRLDFLHLGGPGLLYRHARFQWHLGQIFLANHLSDFIDLVFHRLHLHHPWTLPWRWLGMGAMANLLNRHPLDRGVDPLGPCINQKGAKRLTPDQLISDSADRILGYVNVTDGSEADFR